MMADVSQIATLTGGHLNRQEMQLVKHCYYTNWLSIYQPWLHIFLGPWARYGSHKKSAFHFLTQQPVPLG